MADRTTGRSMGAKLQKLETITCKKSADNHAHANFVLPILSSIKL